MDTSAIIATSLAAGMPFIGGVIWAVRLEGRMDKHEAVDDQREATGDSRHDELQNWLIRVEAKLDNALRQ